jgi:prepilin-type N-terminal cleavage/methylation domain-containing protein
MVSRQDGYTLVEMMMVVGLMVVVTATVVPITDTSLKNSRLRGDADSVRNMVGLAKMRASSQFTRARVNADLNANTYALEVWNKAAAAWVNESGTRPLATGVAFGFNGLSTPPPNTQLEIALSPPCSADLTVGGALEGTACIVFNSRGLPVDADGTLFPRHALYLNGDIGVFGITVTQTPLIRLWASPNGEATWTVK